MATEAPVRFAAVGIDHPHIFDLCAALLRAGAEFVSFVADDEQAEEFGARYPQARRAREAAEVLEDQSVQLVVSAAVSAERGPLGIATMRHGKDFLSDKPAFISLETLEQASAVQREAGQIYAICYSERVLHPATTRAGELVKAGAIGRPLQTIGLGPHRLGAHRRPDWFFEKARYGGIITDIGAHQTDQFLFFTGSRSAEVVSSQIANLGHPDHSELEDFGDALLRGDGGVGYFRVDWFTPDGLPAWGDGRLTVLGTDGFIEIRKNVDIGGRSGGSHLFLIDHQGTRYVDCSDVDPPYARQLLDDIRNRTDTAMPQAHAFLASELAVRAELQATRLTPAAENAHTRAPAPGRQVSPTAAG